MATIVVAEAVTVKVTVSDFEPTVIVTVNVAVASSDVVVNVLLSAPNEKFVVLLIAYERLQPTLLVASM